MNKSLSENKFIVTCILVSFVLQAGYIFFFGGGLDKRLFLAAEMVCVTTTALFFMNRKRNLLSALIVGLIPCVVCYIHSFYETNSMAIIIAILGGAGLSVMYTIMHYSVKLPRGEGDYLTKRSNRRKIVSGGVVSIMVISIALVMVVPIGNANIWSFKKTSSEDAPREYVMSTWKKSKTLDANIETIIKLEDSRWQRLDTDERKETMECLAMVEANYLGLPNFRIKYTGEMKEHTYGRTDFLKNTIYINEKLLKSSSSKEIVDTLFHESRHLYQFKVVEIYNEASKEEQALLLMRDAEMWVQDFEDYDSEGGIRYYTQECEIDARNYAEESTTDVFERINKYLDKTSKEENGEN